MPYILTQNAEAPQFIIAELIGWDEKVPDLHRRAELSEIMKKGTARFEEFELPDLIVVERRRKWMPDLFQSEGGILVSSAAFRDLVETLDPGVHQFSPLAVTWRNGEPIGGEWFGLKVMIRQPGVVIEKSKLRTTGGPAKRYSDTLFMPASPIKYYLEYYPRSVVIDTAQLGDLNLWRDEKIVESLICSDKLHDACVAKGLRILKPHKAKLLSESGEG